MVCLGHCICALQNFAFLYSDGFMGYGFFSASVSEGHWWKAVWCSSRVLRLLPVFCGLISTLSTAAQAQGLAGAETVRVVALRPLNDTLTEPQFRSYTMVRNLIDDFNYRQKMVFVEFQVFEKEQAFRRAAAESIAILSCFDSTFCEKDMRTAEALKLPLVGALSGAAELRPDRNHWSYPVRASEQAEIQAVFDTALSLSVKSLVVGVEPSDYGKRMAALLTSMKKPEGLKVLAQFTLDSKADQQSLVRAVAEKKPSGVLFLSDNPESVTAFVNAWKKSRLTFAPSLLHTSVLANQDYGKHLVGYFGGAGFITAVPSPWSGASLLQRGHQKAAQKAGLYGLSYRSLEMYMATELLLQAIDAGARTPQQLRRVLKETEQFDVGGFRLSYRKGEDVTGFTDFAVLGKAGEFRH